ncbi:MAG: cytidylate kinase-like family protein [Oscillospiraceae bacterium]|nr:cytidylate kinase-like family protein [Oscillospiraceae bacterium]
MIITLGRQHGSNGHDIAKALAEELGFPCYDKEIVDHAAENSNFSKEIFKSYDEKRVSNYIVPSPHYFGMSEGFRMNIKIASAQFDAIRSLADAGDGIFVGRCADYVLRNREDVLRVFIKADMPFRIKTIMARKGLNEDQAKKLIKEVDKDRSSYYKYYTDQIWGDCEYYDVCIDSSRIGVDGAVQVIKSYMNALKK